MRWIERISQPLCCTAYVYVSTVVHARHAAATTKSYDSFQATYGICGGRLASRSEELVSVVQEGSFLRFLFPRGVHVVVGGDAIGDDDVVVVAGTVVTYPGLGIHVSKPHLNWTAKQVYRILNKPHKFKILILIEIASRDKSGRQSGVVEPPICREHQGFTSVETAAACSSAR
jgi:hypothetical protein